MAIHKYGTDGWNTANDNDDVTQGNSPGHGTSVAGIVGTSGATPHVAGTIGLLYSAPCSNLIALAKTDPGAAALQVKQYILNGVDANTSLAGITVAEGRLNINNSMQLLMNNCGPCPTPTSLGTTEVTDTLANLIWNSTDNAMDDTLRWRQVGTADWNIVSNTISPYSLNSLTACTQYEFQVISSCDTISLEYSAVHIFITDGCCEAPQDLTVSNISENSASANWSSVLAAESYNVRIRNNSKKNN